MTKERNLKGFTLIEVLIVIGLIAILAAVTVIALNPTKNFQDARNAERRGEIAQIMNAINQFSIETANQANYTNLVGSVTACGTLDAPIALTGGASVTGVPIGTWIVPSVIAEIPGDPQTGTAALSGYTICKTGTRVTIKAPSAEAGATISLSR